MRISLLTSVVMLAGKLTAYALTHSAAIFADAAESVVHGAATGFAAFSLWYAARPADQDHPYGHGRIVYFSTGFEGALVLAASLTVIYSGIEGLVHGAELANLGIGMTIAGTLAVINLALGVVLVRVGRAHHALALVANGQHVLSDFWTTAAAIVGLILVKLTGVAWLDPAVAIVMGGWIMYSGASLIRQSYAGLMDRVDPELLGRVETTLDKSIEAGLIRDYHQLRCRRLNDEVHIEMHLLVPGSVSLNEAHARATDVEMRLRDSFPRQQVHVVAHIEPAEHDEAHPQGHPEAENHPQADNPAPH